MTYEKMVEEELTKAGDKQFKHLLKFSKSGENPVRFENAVMVLLDCYNHLEDKLFMDDDESEIFSRESLIFICNKIMEKYEKIILTKGGF